jgi:hypothetical protein
MYFVCIHSSVSMIFAITSQFSQLRTNQFCHYKPTVDSVRQAGLQGGICSTRLNDGFPFQHSANRLIRIEPATCCGANDGSNGSEKIGTPV